MTKTCLIQRKRKNIYENSLSEAGHHRDVSWETKRLEVVEAADVVLHVTGN
jgi:hypothetical protein